MIHITIFQDQDEVINGFRCIGHAGFAESGYDIICAGVSALVINAMNSIEELTSAPFLVHKEEKSGLIDFQLTETGDAHATLLLQSMVLGLQNIQEDYGNEYIILDFKEV